MSTVAQNAARKKTTLVTGASGGLGAHFARTLAADGHHVILAARRSDPLRTGVEAIRAEGGSAEALVLDVGDAEAVSRCIAGIDRPIDILVNNAGVSGAGPSMKIDPADFDRVIDVNLNGCFRVAQAVAQKMKAERQGGSIVNIASILGLRVSSTLAAYAASKAGLIQLTKTLALEWARHDIRVNALCPGYIETPINAEFFATDAGKALINRIPQRRLGRMSDLDAPLRLLVSDGAAYITGATLAVDGGHLVSGL